MSDKTKYPRADAISVAKQLVAALNMFCERLIIAGSLRRGKREVGDVEILYIPRSGLIKDASDLFGGMIPVNLAEQQIQQLLEVGILSQRLNERGSTMWGAKNKLATHVASGIPVDLFASTPETWFNQLVCRTGSAENNIRICKGAEKNGLRWNPYGAGFTDLDDGTEIKVTSEQDVFHIAGLDYLEPHQR